MDPSTDRDDPVADAEPEADGFEDRRGPDGPEDDPDPVPVEPGSPTLENVLFVVLGAASTLLAIAALVGALP